MKRTPTALEDSTTIPIFGTNIPLRLVAIDFGLLTVLTGGIAAVYFLVPLPLQRVLALNHQNPQLWDFWTATLIHKHEPGHRHLLSNLGGLFILWTFAWILAILADKRRELLLSSVVMLFPGATTVNLLSYLFYGYQPQVSILYDRGLSGVVGEVTGFLLIVSVLWDSPAALLFGEL